MAEPAAAPIHRIFTATSIIGVPGSGKTSLADAFSVYLWETFQRILLLYSWDGGAIPTGVQKRMRQGLIRFWRARTRSADGLGIETCYLASKGYWPRTINPETGETAPAVDLVAPVATSYATACPQGHPLTTVLHHVQIINQFCPVCRAMIPKEQQRIDATVVRTKGFEQVGGVFFDGLTSMGKVVLDHMDVQRGAGLIGGEKPAFGGVVQSGSVKMGGNNRADIGFGQSRTEQFVSNSLSIPYLVEGPVFTALAMEATDEGGLSIVGLKLPGRAATDDASSWFGNVMEMGRTVDAEGQPHVTLFLRPFTDAQGRRHLLKTSASVWGVPDMLVDPPLSAKQPGKIANLAAVYQMLDLDLKERLAEVDLPTAPGIAAAPTEYGERLTAAAPTPETVTATAATPAPVPPTGTVTPAVMPVTEAPRMPPKKKAPGPANGNVTVQPPMETPPPQAVAATGTTSPPPPGMRPPAKAPGA